MKRIYSILFAVLSVSAVSCLKEERPEQDLYEPEIPVLPEKTMTFTASFVNSKVNIGGPGQAPAWEDKDVITIYSSNGQKVVYVTDIPEGTSTSTVTFHYDRELNGGMDCPVLDPPYYAVYGHQAEDSSLSDGLVHKVQILKEQSVGDRYSVPMIAESATSHLAFKYMAALFVFKVNDDAIRSVSVEADTQISGEGSCNGDGDYFRDLNSDPGFQKVTLRGEFVRNRLYYIAVAPTTIGSLTLYVDGEWAKTMSKPLTLSRYTAYPLGEIVRGE